MIDKYAIAAALTVLMGQACMGQEGKQDLLGFTPGVKFAEVEQLYRDKKISCYAFSKDIIPYGISCGDATLWFSPNLEGAPLVIIYTQLATTASTDEIVASISQQFSKPATPVKDESGRIGGYEWRLGETRLLRYAISGRRLHVVDTALFEKDQQEEKRRAQVPVPKL